ncbi:MAG: acyl-CoA dehydrogenase family protein [Lentisphaerae bacterium]|nr:acyl-CoA dehydrogenase family protein [Lentisphaerota bacterium]
MSANLTADEMIALIRRIVTEKIAPRAAENDATRTFPWDNLHALGEAGFFGLILAEDAGGLGASRSGFAPVVTEIAKGCASTALIYLSSCIVAKAIELGGQAAIKAKWLPRILKGECIGAFAFHEPESGSDSSAIQTRAKRIGDFFSVNGSKFFITSGDEASVYLVLVLTGADEAAPELTTLLIEKDMAGVSFGRPEDKLGLTSTSSRQMFFDDCRVPVANLIGEEGQGAKVLGKAVVGWGLFGAAAISLGLAKAASGIATRHATTRMIGGQPLATHQAVQFMIADMIVSTEAAEALLMACANIADALPETAAFHGMKAKLFASETAVNVTNTALQVMGGHGYCRDYVVERLLRDARGLLLHFKTSEWLRQDIAHMATRV